MARALHRLSIVLLALQLYGANVLTNVLRHLFCLLPQGQVLSNRSHRDPHATATSGICETGCANRQRRALGEVLALSGLLLVLALPAFSRQSSDAEIPDLIEVPDQWHPGVQSSAPGSRSTVVADDKTAPEAGGGAVAADSDSAVFQSVFELVARVPADARSAQEMGTTRRGSAVVIDGKGLMLTVGYLVAEAAQVTVTSGSGVEYQATVVAYDYANGLALLRAPLGESATPMKLGSSASVKKQQKLLALAAGGPEKTGKVEVGAVKKFAGGWGYVVDDAIHTYPPTEAFSGNVLVNDDGELLGIGALVSIDIDIDPKIRVPGNIFVPVDKLTAVLGELLTVGRSGDSERPWLGIEVRQTSEGIVVKGVVEGSPAAESGISDGDKIVAVNQLEVSKLADFYSKVWDGHKPGDAVHLLIVREGRYANVPVASISPYDWYNLDNTTTVISGLDD